MEEKSAGFGGKTNKKLRKKDRIDKEVYWVFGVIFGVILIFFAARYFVFQSFNTFEYEGFAFKKESIGDIPLYHLYFLSDLGSVTGRASGSGETRQVNIYLRDDPRKNNIAVEGGKIEFIAGKFVYVTINGTGIVECPYSSVAMASLASFLSQSGFTLRVGTPDEEEANEINQSNFKHITCESRPDNPVIHILSGSETKITRTNNCYEIITANCEILPAVEKFIVQTLIDARRN